MNPTSSSINNPEAVLKQIADAKFFFMAVVDTNATQKFQKTLLWQNASIAHYKGGNRILIPVEYDKNYNFISSISGDIELSLEKQSYAEVYKINNTYMFDIIHYIPSEYCINNKTKIYSGVVFTTDWSDKILTVAKFNMPNKAGSNNSSISNQRTMMVGCDVWIDWYSCPPAAGGSPAMTSVNNRITTMTINSSCTYVGSECLIPSGSDGGGGGGGGSSSAANSQIPTDIDSVAVTTPQTLLLGGILGYYHVESTWQLVGIKFASNTIYNYFTSLPTATSQLLIDGPSLPTPSYSVDYLTPNWVTLNFSVKCEGKGYVNTSLYPTNTVQNVKTYAAPFDL